jgi:hypothetical protein
MMMIQGANKSKLRDSGLHRWREIGEKNGTRKIIDFESGRKALEYERFDDEQDRPGLMKRGHVPSKLPAGWIEFLLTLAPLLGLLVGVIASWRS